MGIIFPQKNVPDARIDHVTAACEADSLPTELPCPVSKMLSMLSEYSDMAGWLHGLISFYFINVES